MSDATHRTRREARLIVEARLGRRAAGHARGRGRPRGVGRRARAAARSRPRSALMRAETPASRSRASGALPRPSSQKGVLARGRRVRHHRDRDRLLGGAAGLAASARRSSSAALIVALPLTLALQWGAAQPLPRSPARARPARATRAACCSAGASRRSALPALLLGLSRRCSRACSRVTWTGGTILIRRGWAAVLRRRSSWWRRPRWSAGRVAAARRRSAACRRDRARRGGGPAHVRRCRAPSARANGTRACVAAAVIGTGLGLMLVLDRTVSWTEGAVPALALLPVDGRELLGRLPPAPPRAGDPAAVRRASR